MTVISVEVSEKIASKFKGKKIVSSEVLYRELDNNFETVVDFGEKGIGKKEFEEYLSSNSK